MTWEFFLIQWMPAIIQAIATILAAIIGAWMVGGSFKRVIKQDMIPMLHTYLDKSHSSHEIMQKAKKSIFVVVSLGNHFLKENSEHIQEYLDNGVKLYFLMHNETKGRELKGYLTNDNNIYKYRREEVVQMLLNIKKKCLNPDLVEIRESSFNFTASYIGIDIENAFGSEKCPAHAVIQVMLYQYNVRSGKSPILYLSANDNWGLFQQAAQSIKKMWDEGVPIPEVNNATENS